MNWSKELSPSEVGSSGKKSNYDHIECETPIGLAVIEWKSWKKHDYPCLTIGDEWISEYFDVDEAKKAAADHLKCISEKLLATIGSPVVLCNPSKTYRDTLNALLSKTDEELDKPVYADDVVRYIAYASRMYYERSHVYNAFKLEKYKNRDIFFEELLEKAFNFSDEIVAKMEKDPSCFEGDYGIDDFCAEQVDEWIHDNVFEDEEFDF